MITPKSALVLASALLAAVSAHAQLAAYGTVTVRRMTGVNYTQSTTNSTSGSFDPLGGTGGLFYDFKTVGPVRLGIDARGSIVSSKQGADPYARASGGRIYSSLAGLRATFHTPFVPVKPYVQGSVGLGRSDYGIPTTTGKVNIYSGLEYDAFAGVDISVLPYLDFRMVEVGYGALMGPSHTYPVGSLSSGIVIHIPIIGRK